MIEDHQLGLVDSQRFADFFHLARTDEETRIGPASTAGQQRGRLRAGRAHELEKFSGILTLAFVLEVHMDEYRRLTGVGTFEKQSIPHALLSGCAGTSVAGRRTLRDGTTVEMACL